MERVCYEGKRVDGIACGIVSNCRATSKWPGRLTGDKFDKEEDGINC